MLAMLMLVGCGEKPIGEYITEYDKPTEKELLTYNLYIVCEDETSEDAKTVVRRRIADYTEKSNMKILLNVVFCSAAEYDALIKNATNPEMSYDSNTSLTEDEKNGKVPQADIFLITSAAMMDEMVAGNRVADLTEYFNGSYEYGKLNAQIATSLLKASMIDNKYYAIPNNYVVGEYTYLSVNFLAAHLNGVSEIKIKRDDAGVFGTEYFWLLVSALGENPANFVSVVEDSQISDPSLLASAYDVMAPVISNDASGNPASYSYILINREAAAKHNLDCTGIATYSDAVYMYQQNPEKSKNIAKAIFDEVFRELGTAAVLSASDVNLLNNKSEDYYNRIASEDNSNSTYIFFNKNMSDTVGLNNNAYFANCDLPANNSVIQLWNKISASGGNPADYIKIVKGSYDMKAAIEAGDTNSRNICNIIKLPEATKADAFSGAFAINAKVKDAERAMEVLYAINNDKTLHNYLQYGIPDTNYNFAEDGKDAGIIVRSHDDTTSYIMNPRYTGDLFGIYYCEELGWMPSNVDSAKKQNDASVFNP